MTSKKKTKNKNKVHPVNIKPSLKCSKSIDSDDSSFFELDEKNLFTCVNQSRKVSLIPDILRFENEQDNSNDAGQNKDIKNIVVIVRDFSQLYENLLDNESPAKALKEKLLSHKMKSYIITVPSLLEDLQAVQLMKGCPQHSLDNPYARLLLAIVQEKIKEKVGKVLILNFPTNQDSICPMELKHFCETVCRAGVFQLDKSKSTTFEARLEKFTKRICRFRHETQIKNSQQGPSKDALGLDADNDNNLPGVFQNDNNNNTAEECLQSPCEENCILQSDSGSDPETASELRIKIEACLASMSKSTIALVQEEALEPLAVDFNLNVEIKDDQEMQEKELEQEGFSLEISHEEEKMCTNEEDELKVLEEMYNSLPVKERDAIKLPEKSETEEHVVPLEPELESEISNEPYIEDITSVAGYTEDQNWQDRMLVRVRKKRRDFISDALHQVSHHCTISLKQASESNSEESLNISLLFAQKKKLLKIHVTPPDESRYPSSMFTKIPFLKSSNEKDTSSLYKGWIALPANEDPLVSISEKWSAELNKINSGIESNNMGARMKRIGEVIKRALKPIGSLFSCEACRDHNRNTRHRRNTPERMDYPEIMLKSQAFNQKYE